YKCYISSERNMKNPTASPEEVGSSLLILGTALKYKPFASITKKTLKYCQNYMRDGKISFFRDNSLPPDIDITSWALSTFIEMKKLDKDIANRIAEEILSNVNKDGILEVYFKSYRSVDNRIDHVAIANALYFLYLMGKKNKITNINQKYIMKVLYSGRYLEGSHYYHSPDTFLYMLARLNKFYYFQEKFGNIIKDHLIQRINATDWPLDISMRISSLNKFNILDLVEIKKILKLQQNDGGWPIDSIYHYGSKVGYFGSRSISSAFAIEALIEFKNYCLKLF
ncbi:MAG: hypothetical protein J7J93_03030, partial [Candidatus Aenigmarchaeota archaeon]|nr:hypothetical protein [Candidatus Aenigmarchaeota archaeon]